MLDTGITFQNCTDVAAANGLATGIAGALAPFREVAEAYKKRNQDSGFSNLQAEAARFASMAAESVMLTHFRNEVSADYSGDIIGQCMEQGGKYRRAA